MALTLKQLGKDKPKKARPVIPPWRDLKTVEEEAKELEEKEKKRFEKNQLLLSFSKTAEDLQK